jgi:hypothetical protein
MRPGQGLQNLPSHDALYHDVKEVRRRGVGNPQQPLANLTALLEVARMVSVARTDEAKIEETLRRAVNRLGGMSTTAVSALLGLDHQTRGLKVEDRRARAAEYYDYKTAATFRAHFESPLLMAVATQLMAMRDDPGTNTRRLGLRFGNKHRKAFQERKERALKFSTWGTAFAITKRRLYFDFTLAEGFDLQSGELLAILVALLAIAAGLVIVILLIV